MKFLLSAMLSAVLMAAGTGFAAKLPEKKFSPEDFVRDRNELVFEKELSVGYGKIYQFRQTYHGMDVLGASCTVSTDLEGNVLSVNDKTKPIGSPIAEKIGYERAEETALSYGGEILSGERVVYGETPQICYDFVSTANGGTEIVVSAQSGEPVLVAPLTSYATVLIRQKNFFGEEVQLPIECEEDGKLGKVFYLSDEVRNIYCYDAKGQFSGDMPLYQNVSGVFSDSMAVSVYETIVKAYDFYADEKNVGVSYKGINGKNDDIEENYVEAGEIPLIALIHYGMEYENANCGYDPMQQAAVMYVGDGRRSGTLYNQGRATDVIAHEYQHAVTEFVSPSGLYYLNETGAINESISDIFGSLVEGYELTDKRFWAIGEEAGPVTDEEGIRSMSQPTGFDVMHMSDERALCYQNHDHSQAPCDNGNVHANSTILTHAQYRMWQKMPDYFTRERIGKLWFATLGTLSRTCTFKEFAQEMIKAASALGFDRDAQDVIYETFFESGILVEEDVVTHTVTFRYNASILEKITVRDGQASYYPTLPDREVAAGKYEFKGWDKDLTNVTGNLVTDPVFDVTLNKYTVKFYSEGEEFYSVEVEHGKSASAPESVPQKEGNERCEYEFDGWDASLDDVTSDREIHAKFREILRRFSVTFESEGREISKQEVEYGNLATPPEDNPVKASDERYDYTFDGWDREPSEEITEDTVFRAKFKSQQRKYSVKFMNEGNVQAEGYWHYDDVLNPEPLEEKGKTFDGWYLDENFTSKAENIRVTGDMTLYAKWKESSNVGLIVGICAGAVLLCAGAVVLTVVLKRKRR